ncbi:MAG TPA: NAD-dependent epimerase/dehydratase family protein [Thermoanaerobaculia bacterium]|nr:NAD-dependent epimerase/dehydratase family protein [Thermoanaerobaculia bacterium]
MPVGARSTVLVTGASGFLGRHVVRLLLERSHCVVAVSRNPASLADLEHARLTAIVGDIEREVPPIEPGMTVIQLAALRIGVRQRRARYFAMNHDATLRLASSALAAGVSRFINVSTAVVLGPSRGAPLDETHQIGRSEGRNAYIDSRAAALLDLERMVKNGLPLVTLMPSIVFGPDHSSRPNYITSHIRRILSSPVRIHIGHADRVRSLAFVDDVVNAIVQAVECELDPGSRFLLAGSEVSMREFEELVFELAGKWRSPVIRLPHTLARAFSGLADGLIRRGKGRGSGSELRI